MTRQPVAQRLTPSTSGMMDSKRHQRVNPPSQTLLATESPRLKMSDYWFLFGLALALFFVADPFFLRLDKFGPTKHLPLVISSIGVLLGSIGNYVFSSQHHASTPHWRILSAGFPLILLGGWIVLGSLYTRQFNAINNTFITVGLYMLFTFLTARIILISHARLAIVRAYLFVAALLSVFMVLRMATNFDGMHVNYHELEALMIPLAIYYATRPTSPPNHHRSYTQIILVLFFLSAGLVFRKNTGFLVLMMTVLYLWIVEWRWRFRESPKFRALTLCWVVLVLISMLLATAYFAQKQALLPSGNPEYRMLTYDIAWQKFMHSPLWGTGFTGQATEKFTAYTINSAQGNLATHSDILDLAAQGGVIAVLLWLWGYIRVLRLSMQQPILNTRPRDDLRAAAHTFACMSIASIVVYAFNPILLQPAKSLLMWGHLGMLLGIGLHLTKPVNQAP